MPLVGMQEKKYDAQSVIADYLSGRPLGEVALLHRIGHETVRNILIRGGVPRRKATPPVKNIGPTKVCSMCQEPKSRGEFYGQGIRTSICKPCDRLRKRVEYAEGDTSYRARSIDRIVEFRKTVGPEYATDRSRQKHSNWSPEEFDAAWQTQKGQCAICENPMVLGGVTNTSVCADHDHQTGRPRSLLCARCNKHLGIFEKHRQKFEAYLERWSAR